MAKKPSLSIVRPTPTGTPPPSKLGRAGLELWNAVMSEYDLRDSGGLAILMQACSATDRVDAIAERISADGEMITVRGVLRSHPLLRDELQGRAFICRSLQRLGLNVEAIKPTAGRPPGAY